MTFFFIHVVWFAFIYRFKFSLRYWCNKSNSKQKKKSCMLEIRLLEPSMFEWYHGDNVNMNSYAGVHNTWMYYKAPHELNIFLFWISQNLAGPRSDLMSEHLLNNAFVEATCKVHVIEKKTHAVWIFNSIFKISIHLMLL